MSVNTNLLKALKKIVSQHGGLETLSNPGQVKALLSELATDEPKPQKNALIACLEQGFVALLQNVPARERGPAKAKPAERLNREKGLDPALCADTLDLLEAALIEAERSDAKTGGPVCPACGATVEGTAVTPAPEAPPSAGQALPQAPAKPRCGKRSNAVKVMLACALLAVIAVVWVIHSLTNREVWRELRTLEGHTDCVIKNGKPPALPG